MISLTQLFYGRTLPSVSFAKRTCVAIFSLDVQMNMLQVSSYQLQVEIRLDSAILFRSFAHNRFK